jgi:hypothetical protein
MKYDDKQITCMFWWSWNELPNVQLWQQRTIAGKLKKDDFNGWVYIVGEDWVIHE